MRAGDIEKVRRLLGRQFGVDGDDRDRVTLGHLSENIDQQAKRRHWDFYLLLPVNDAQPCGLTPTDARGQEPAAIAGDLSFLLGGQRRGRRWGADGRSPPCAFDWHAPSCEGSRSVHAAGNRTGGQ